MQKTEIRQTAKSAHRQVQASTTLNRRYVQKPARTVTGSDIKTSLPRPKITRFGSQTVQSAAQSNTPIQASKPHPTQVLANQRMRERQQQITKNERPRPTAKELKDQAIKKALLAASKQTSTDSTLSQQIQTKDISTKEKKMHFGVGRIALALSCAVAAVFAILYFVNLNMPDIQFRATAAQLNALYPNYIPYNYSPVEISSENNTVSITFRNKVSDDTFIITEEKSSWDSNSLLNNYVKDTFGEDYSILREKGITIYTNGNDAAWVNGGVVYKLNTKKGALSKKQISDIAASF